MIGRALHEEHIDIILFGRDIGDKGAMHGVPADHDGGGHIFETDMIHIVYSVGRHEAILPFKNWEIEEIGEHAFEKGFIRPCLEPIAFFLQELVQREGKPLDWSQD